MRVQSSSQIVPASEHSKLGQWLSQKCPEISRERIAKTKGRSVIDKTVRTGTESSKMPATPVNPIVPA
jgi:hypothetical protein